MRQQVSVIHQQDNPVAARVQGCEGIEAAFDVVIPCCLAGPSDLFHESLQVERRGNPQNARAPFREHVRDAGQHGSGAVCTGQQQGTAACQVRGKLLGWPKPAR